MQLLLKTRRLYRLLKFLDLITSPAFIVIKAATYSNSYVDVQLICVNVVLLEMGMIVFVYAEILGLTEGHESVGVISDPTEVRTLDFSTGLMGLNVVEICKFAATGGFAEIG